MLAIYKHMLHYDLLCNSGSKAVHPPLVLNFFSSGLGWLGRGIVDLLDDEGSFSRRWLAPGGKGC
jgi:hypothetical protein